MTRIITIEGNIGSGKSTFVKALRDKYKNNEKIYFLDEPVNIWESIKNNEGQNIIECFYANQEKYAFSFQIMAYISRLSLLRKAVKEGYDIIITERCIYTDRYVFAKMLYENNKIDIINYEIYNKWFDEFIDEFPNFNYIYIKTDPNVALERVNKRSRTGESIPLEYLVECDKYHNNWLNDINSMNLITLDGNVNRDYTNNETFNDWFKIVDDLI